VYDEAGQLLGQYNNVGQPLQQYVWLGGQPVGVIVPWPPAPPPEEGQPPPPTPLPKLWYVQSDALGSPRSIIDPVRNLAVWRWDETKETFGDHAPNTDPDNDGTHLVFDLRFPGQRYDAASGLHYNYFRDYDPAVGRYTQSDPIGLAGGINTYAYAGSMPTGAIDPMGLYANIVELADAYGVDPELPVWAESAAWGVAAAAGIGIAVIVAAPLVAAVGTAIGTYGLIAGVLSTPIELTGLAFIGADIVGGYAMIGTRMPPPTARVAMAAAQGENAAIQLGANAAGKICPATEAGAAMRIRHYTSNKGLNGIRDSGVIRASDQNKVFAEAARGKPLSPRDAEQAYGLKQGRGRNYIETDVSADRVQRVYNPLTRSYELQVVGDVHLQNATFHRR
jgi:RHS repeat-associated protein